ncbi:hypothetical protein SELMODRAFT_418014 [Selaginella moellendorffii]|uniref:Uncharacterized protein n=1 Tax=Selaginella moellendorffii TaxID=88036 RepID=D8S4D9_SELML|nr:hypothetical protein SELMODRAFT_418014 [Selaginella moellendorffii]
MKTVAPLVIASDLNSPLVVSGYNFSVSFQASIVIQTFDVWYSVEINWRTGCGRHIKNQQAFWKDRTYDLERVSETSSPPPTTTKLFSSSIPEQFFLPNTVPPTKAKLVPQEQLCTPPLVNRPLGHPGFVTPYGLGGVPGCKVPSVVQGVPENVHRFEAPRYLCGGAI